MNIDITSLFPDNRPVKKLRCSIILCRPEDSRNIGSVCRAMKTMGLTDLRIVGNPEDYTPDQVRILAVHAGDVWEHARFFEPSPEGLRLASRDCTLVAGTTRRMGQKRKSWGMTPGQFAELAHRNPEGQAAVVFGNERTGLTDEELDCCSVAINIPSNPDYPSLNLSHAVQILTYTLYTHDHTRRTGYTPINRERLERLVQTIGKSTDRIGLFKLAGRAAHDRFMESILSRAALSESEAKQLEKLFHRMSFIKNPDAPDK